MKENTGKIRKCVLTSCTGQLLGREVPFAPVQHAPTANACQPSPYFNKSKGPLYRKTFARISSYLSKKGGVWKNKKKTGNVSLLKTLCQWKREVKKAFPKKILLSKEEPKISSYRRCGKKRKMFLSFSSFFAHSRLHAGQFVFYS